MNALAWDAATQARVRGSQWGLAAGLRTAGWLTVTALASFGLLVILFFAVGNFTIEGTMLQLANLASRYVAADAARQAQFDTLLASAALIAFAAIGVLRRASLLEIFSKADTNHG